MSEQNTKPVKANERPKYGPQGRGGGPMGHGTGTGEKAISFGPSMKRLLSHLGPELPLIIAVVVMVALATAGNAIGPAVLGQGTNLIYDAVVVNHTAIDFTALSRVLILAAVLYIGFFGLSWAAGLMVNSIVQRSIYRMRKQVSEKIARLPLKYFDSQPRGELLSRVTNDVDNISQSLQQTLCRSCPICSPSSVWSR